MINFNLLDFFKLVENDKYCIIKMSEKFPFYSAGNDIDVFTNDADLFVSRIINFFAEEVDKGLSVKVERKCHGDHIYVDIFDKDCFFFRFDLYSEMPKFYKTNIRNSLFDIVIENSMVKFFKENSSVGVKVPSLVDDCIIRYIEYTEWFNERPDKIKHMEHILNILQDEEDRRSFFDKLHRYVKLPIEVYESKNPSNDKIAPKDEQKWIYNIFRWFKNKSIKRFILKKVLRSR